MTTENLEQRILSYIERRGGGVSCAELSRDVDGFDGDLELCVRDENTVLWSGISDEAINALKRLQETRRIFLATTGPLTYMLDGLMLNLPVVKTAGYRYKKPHWQPIVFWTPDQNPELAEKADA